MSNLQGDVTIKRSPKLPGPLAAQPAANRRIQGVYSNGERSPSPPSPSPKATPTRWRTTTSDAILDAILRQGPAARAWPPRRCVTTGWWCSRRRSITQRAGGSPSRPRATPLKRIGYDNTEYGIDYAGRAVLVGLLRQAEQTISPRADQASDDHQHRRGRPGPDVRLRLRRDARAHARA